MGHALVNFTTPLESMECCVCGVTFAMPAHMLKIAREKGNFAQMFYCPNGHKQGFGSSAADKLREKLEAAKRDAEWQRQRVETMSKRISAQKGQMTKLQKRIGHGVCPCCQRTFKQLAAHMANKHPEYAQGSGEAQDAAK